MLSKNSISIFVSTFLIIGLIYLVLPENGYSGTDEKLVVKVSCCQYVNLDQKNGGEAFCLDGLSGGGCPKALGELTGEFKGESCLESGECTVTVKSPIPTLSEWGLIALAGTLGIIGFMVIRRRKVTA